MRNKRLYIFGIFSRVSSSEFQAFPFLYLERNREDASFSRQTRASTFRRRRSNCAAVRRAGVRFLQRVSVIVVVVVVIVVVIVVVVVVTAAACARGHVAFSRVHDAASMPVRGNDASNNRRHVSHRGTYWPAYLTPRCAIMNRVHREVNARQWEMGQWETTKGTMDDTRNKCLPQRGRT